MQKAHVATFSTLCLLWVAAALASAAHGASLYKCRGAEGSVSYQSQPCGPGDEEVWERAVAPEASPGAAPVERSADRLPVAPALSPPRARDSSDAGARRRVADAACRRARAADAAYRGQVLSKVRHDGLRRHSDRVRAACG